MQDSNHRPPEQLSEMVTVRAPHSLVSVVGAQIRWNQANRFFAKAKQIPFQEFNNVKLCQFCKKIVIFGH